jgi:dTDP-4-amino-4,6-dideoxygalactose transaminase
MPFSKEDAERIGREVTELINSGYLSMGKHCLKFEELFSRFCGSTYALGVQSGTAALEIIARALELEGASVCVPANTFMATALAPIAAGARIILVDTDPATLQMDPEDLGKKIRPDTRAVIITHLGGFISPDIGKIKDISKDNGAVLIEDAAHAHGAEIDGRKAGTLGDGAAFSFYATKVMTTAEGGMVMTDSESLYNKTLVLRQHGQIRPGSNIHEAFGLNYRPSEIHALLGINLMERAEAILSGRRKAALLYDELLLGTPLRPLIPPSNILPSYYKYIAFLPDGLSRESFKEKLLSRRGQRLAGEVYSVPLHLQPYWRSNPERLASAPLELKGAEEVCRKHICLPIWPGIPEESQKLVVSWLLETLNDF